MHKQEGVDPEPDQLQHTHTRQVHRLTSRATGFTHSSGSSSLSSEDNNDFCVGTSDLNMLCVPGPEVSSASEQSGFTRRCWRSRETAADRFLHI